MILPARNELLQSSAGKLAAFRRDFLLSRENTQPMMTHTNEIGRLRELFLILSKCGGLSACVCLWVSLLGQGIYVPSTQLASGGLYGCMFCMSYITNHRTRYYLKGDYSLSLSPSHSKLDTRRSLC